MKRKNSIIIGSLLILIIAIVVIGVVFSKDKESESTHNNNQPKTESAVKDKELQKESDSSTNLEDENQDSVVEQQEQKNHQEQQKQEEQAKQENQVVMDNGYIQGQTLPNEPTYINGVLIANKKYPLPKDYAPGEDSEARAAFDLMAQDAKKQGFEIVAFSTYRSYEYQSTLYNRYVEKDGKDNADRYSARPGYSEHQTGLAFDVGEKGKENLWLTEEFGETDAGKWLMENAHKYGFILRYPKGKEPITGYMYESWHYRYLGVELATKVKESGLTLEEYLGID